MGLSRRAALGVLYRRSAKAGSGRARAKSSAGAISPPTSKKRSSEPPAAFTTQEAPTKPSKLARPGAQPVTDLGHYLKEPEDFEASAREAWDDDSIELTEADEAHIDAARERVRSFAKDQALLDWLDEPECRCGCPLCAKGRHLLCSRCLGSPSSMLRLAVDSQDHGATPAFAPVPAGGGATTIDETLEYGPRAHAASIVAPPGEVLEGGDADAVQDARRDSAGSERPREATAPLVRVTGGALVALAQEAAEHATKSKSKRTLVEYQKQWTMFAEWCHRNARVALPAEAATLALYITVRAHDVGLSSLGQALSAIVYYHDRARLPSPRHDPVVKDVLEGITRGKGRAKKKKDALTLAKLQRILPVLSGETAIRDRALLLIGYVAGLRRAELVATLVVHFKRDDLGRGYLLTVPRSKTDQSGQGMLKAIPANRRDRLMCPASALEDWLLVSGIASGAVFRGIQNFDVTNETLWGDDVARIVKRWAKRAGVEGWENLSGHSLRAGFITDARRQKQSWASITKQTGQTEKTAEGYVREEEIWEDNAAVELFR